MPVHWNGYLSVKNPSVCENIYFKSLRKLIALFLQVHSSDTELLLWYENRVLLPEAWNIIPDVRFKITEDGHIPTEMIVIEKLSYITTFKRNREILHYMIALGNTSKKIIPINLILCR